VKQRAIDSIHRLPYLLQHEHMAVEVRFERCAEQVAQHRYVERRGLSRTVDRRFE